MRVLAVVNDSPGYIEVVKEFAVLALLDGVVADGGVITDVVVVRVGIGSN